MDDKYEIATRKSCI